MNILEYLKKNIVYLDGGMGTLLQKKGLLPGEFPERWNISHPEVIVEIQKSYFDAGSNIICSNTFGANLLKFDENELTAIIQAAVSNAMKAKNLSVGKQEKFIALDVGPLGKLLKPFGDYDFEEAINVFSKTVEIGSKCGVDLIFIETMNDSYETKAALLAAKESCDLPVFVSNAYDETGKLMTGASPAAMVAFLEGMHADAIGLNCSMGPKQLQGVVKEYLQYASVPVLVKPNAGLPKSINGETVYDILPDEFSEDMLGFLKDGVRIAGGCCGTTPDYISAVVNKSSNLQPKSITDKNISMVSSYTHAVEFDRFPVIIGERINPTGKKRFKEALINQDIDYILGEGLSQQEKGADILDVNVGLPEIDEVKMLKKTIYELQAILDLPLQIDTSNYDAMETALRYYNGKAMINSVNGKEEVMRKVFPLVKKYGGFVVCLTLDENGIPEDPKTRVDIAKKIISIAEEYGIAKKDLIFDTLAMTISTNNALARVTLQSLKTIKQELGCHTSLGVSNISFGLPNREAINAAFFTLAMENGLSAAIINPGSNEMMKSYYTYCALAGIDENCTNYIANIDKFVTVVQDSVKEVPQKDASTVSFQSDLQRAIVKGLKDQAASYTLELLKTEKPLDIVANQVIPALDIVGQGFEKKTMYLPQLLMSAEAAQSAFEQIKKQLSKENTESVNLGKFVVATVYGDIHDIGKNIVKLILENYGFEVYDLGKDVPPQDVVDLVIKQHAPFVGLSALMTTTVPAMEETITLLHEKAPWTKVIVGGAVLTEEYAQSIGADYYAKDAMATVRYAMQEEK